MNLNIENLNHDKEILDIKDLISSTENDITFFIQKNIKMLHSTKASLCITIEALKNELPKTCTAIIVDNVLVSTSKITSLFYPDSINDDFDQSK